MIAKGTALFKRLWSAALVDTAILVVALAASAVFGVRAVLFWHTAPPWAERQQEIAD